MVVDVHVSVFLITLFLCVFGETRFNKEFQQQINVVGCFRTLVISFILNQQYPGLICSNVFIDFIALIVLLLLSVCVQQTFKRINK